MLSFECDYNVGAHPRILERLVETNFEKLPGYREDHYCKEAAAKIAKACECPEAEVHFLVGGTQTNQVVISTMLKSYEGVVAAKTGHVAVHEAGAIEYSGHKVLEIPGYDGKIHGDELLEFLKTFYGDETHDHMVFPGMVYISHPTEYGTLYSKAELAEISEICRNYEMPLFIDGARLGYGLASEQTDVDLADIAKYSDVFYIGGTKVGALCGEAVVFTKNNAPKQFVTMTKQRGAMLAKGRLLGIQFDTLFTDGLYYEISKNAIEMAEKLKDILHKKGYRFFLESPTNQQFVYLNDEQLERIKGKVSYSFWEETKDGLIVRFATSWATTEEDLAALEEIL